MNHLPSCRDAKMRDIFDDTCECPEDHDEALYCDHCGVTVYDDTQAAEWNGAICPACVETMAMCDDCGASFTPADKFASDTRCESCETEKMANFDGEDCPADWWSGPIAENH